MFGRELVNYGYEVRVFSDTEAALDECEKNMPIALAADTRPEMGASLMGVAEILRLAEEDDLPVIYISEQGDLDSRIQAVRFGGQAFFTLPGNIGEVAAALDRLTGRAEKDSYQALLATSNSALPGTIENALDGANINIRVEEDPLRLLDSALDHAPDLFLLEADYNACTGEELAGVIRQHESLHTIPIIFVTENSLASSRAETLKNSGDEFITLPREKHEFLFQMKMRLTRSHALTRLLHEDNLTGLLNHTSLMNRFARKLEQAKKTGRPLSYAMIDIDRFRSVNETHGTATADNVIKNLSRFISRYLPKTCLAGRYGGEEFGIVLPDFSLADATAVLDDARQGFSLLRQSSRKKDFRVTFSCGIASYPEFQGLSELTRTADERLYAAKNSGRNRVVSS